MKVLELPVHIGYLSQNWKIKNGDLTQLMIATSTKVIMFSFQTKLPRNNEAKI